MQHRTLIMCIMFLLLLVAMPVGAIGEPDEEPEPRDLDIMPAEIENDEGGPVVITGEVAYTNAFFTSGTSEPLIILEDQTGFVNRDRSYIIPVESQQIGQITSDFYSSPFTYSLALPIEPQAPLNDVDHDGEEDTGVMIFQVAYWTNTFGDAFLEERDLGGGGWSGAYSSADVSGLVQNRGEYIGGIIIIYAPEEGQAFPAGFGDDDMLFTEDDPLVIVPQGYTIVDMNDDEFVFDRTREPVIDLIEGEGAAADDFSDMSYTDAFDAMIEKMELEYAFSEYKDINWDELYEEYLPIIEGAEVNNDTALFSTTLRDFLSEIPDGHIAMSLTLATYEEFAYNTDGGLGFAIRELDDGRVVVTFVTENGPADEAGIKIQAEIIEINGDAVQDVVEDIIPFSGPFSTEHVLRLQQLRYATRYPIGTEVEITYINPDDDEEETVALVAVAELESFSHSSFFVENTGYELPVEYEPFGDYLRVEITGFLDDARLSIQLWERMLETAIANDVPAIIIDMRNNGGGSGYLADQMAAYFFDDPLILGNAGAYDESVGEFFFDPQTTDAFILPPEDLRYDGEVVVLVGPNCASACEFFSYNMTVDNRATIIGQYPTAGLGGGVEQFFMPDNISIQITVTRAVDPDGEIHIEGIGVVPDVRVPVTLETLFSDEDVILEAAIEFLNDILLSD